MNNYLWDTNAVIDYLNGKIPLSAIKKLNNIVDDIVTVSVITQIEVLSWRKASPEEIAMATGFINESNILSLDAEVVKQTIQIRLQKSIKLPDAIIAATAINNGFILISRNLSDFSGICSLTVVNPYEW